jgi:hypothetical protein
MKSNLFSPLNTIYVRTSEEDLSWNKKICPECRKAVEDLYVEHPKVQNPDPSTGGLISFPGLWHVECITSAIERIFTEGAPVEAVRTPPSPDAS